MANRSSFLVIFPDNVQIYSATTREAAFSHAKKKEPNGKVIHIMFNVETQELESREVEEEKDV